ncbi:MAG TPA: lamin tail domain-containing protein [Pyrinomonadaceae bacterium]|nr:lamin tail domain-containing protein [Pyrinomonadaceae bacterium]
MSTSLFTRRRSTSARRLLSVALVASLLAVLLPTPLAPVVTPVAEAVSTTVVVSQVYGGAGCGTAGCSTYKNDYIELFNRGASAVSLNGWSVQYAAATGTAWQVTSLTNVTLQPGQYYLVAEGAGSNGVNNIPPPDATGTIAMSATSAKVALVNTTTALSGQCGNGAATTLPASVIDFVGYGTTANCNDAGGTTGGTGNAPAPSTTNADFRAAAGCTDTDNNAADFTAAAASPRNTSTALNACNASTPTPTPTPTPSGPSLAVNDVSQNEGNSGFTAFTFTVSLSTATHGGVTFDIATADGTASSSSDYVANSATGVTIPNGQQTAQFTVQVSGEATSEPNETFFVNVTNVTGATVTDGQGQGTIVNDDATLALISQVQGSGTSSPFVGQTVGVRGIVTLLKSNGFFLQEEVGDNDSDPNTSEGIFVFVSTAPPVAVGDQATVTGTVVEFNGLTEISTSNANVQVSSTGNTLPTAVTLTPADLPPTANFAQPQLEKYEGMRLFASSLTTVAPNDTFFDVFTVLTGQPRPFREPGIPASDPIPPDPTSGTPDCCIPVWDENPERLLVDTNGRAGSTGETLTSNVVLTNVAGPLDFAFGAYRLVNEANLTRSANMSAVPVPTPTAGEFTVAGYNIENFNNNATQRQKAALAVRDVLRLPDIIGTAEIFDLADLQALAAEIQTISGVAYSAHLIEQDGTSEDSDQDVGFLVKTSRVSVTSVTAERTADTFVNPNTGQPETAHDRPPLLLRGTVDPSGPNPLPVLVVVNHLRSFIDIEQVTGEGPRVRAKRKAQAESLAGLLQELQVNNPTTPVISVGDYNAFQFNNGYDDPISVIKGQPTPDEQIVVDQSPDLVNPDFYNLIDDLPASGRYTFIFEGTPQALDHVLVNTVARARNSRTAVARHNADFPEATASVFASNAARPERNSDHDPVVAYFTLGTPQPAGSLIISEFRFRGPAVAATPDPGESDDEFVEVYNNTDSDITVSTTDGSSGWAVVGSDGTTLVTIPNGTVIPARGHWLGVNAVEYSLSDYGGTGAAEGNDGWIGSSIPDNGGVAIFRTSNPANYTLAERLDAAGYTTAPALYREGAGLPTGGPEFNANVSNFSFFRSLVTASGRPKDTGDNASDFLGASVDGAGTGLGQRLGAPGPENLSSPVMKSSATEIASRLIDPCVSSSAAPNRVRVTGSYTDTLSGTGTYALGYLDIRRAFVNQTGQNVTRLRFRISDMSTFPAPAGIADMRAMSSPDVSVTGGAGCASPLPVKGVTLEQPPAQALGGGYNSTLSAGTITLGTPMAPNEIVSLNFRLGVRQSGSFRFFIIVEALP